MRNLPGSLILCATAAVIGLWAAVPSHPAPIVRASTPTTVVTRIAATSAHITRAGRMRLDLCGEWAAGFVAQGMDASETDYTLHTMGCVAPWGVYVRDDSRCMRLAYHETAYASPHRAYSYRAIGRHHCVLYEDGTWGNE